jgi:4a-hydroxytetrahydrobiopterin dehydratase
MRCSGFLDRFCTALRHRPGAMTMTRLTETDRANAMASLSQWRYDADAGTIVREFRFADFVEAFGFMSKVAMLAERHNHHPDWRNVYDRVTITLTDYEAGGVSRRDIDLAAAIDNCVG